MCFMQGSDNDMLNSAGWRDKLSPAEGFYHYFTRRVTITALKKE